MRTWLYILLASVAAAVLCFNTDAYAKPPKKRVVRKAVKTLPKPVESVVPAQVVTEDTGKKAKMYTFGAMDIDGKLKAPQLMYFLNRVKGEFDDSTLDRRSFMPELSRSGGDPNL